MDKLKFVTCNMRGMRDVNKRRQIFRYLHEKNADVVFLQETHAIKNNERQWKAEWGGRIIYDNWTSEAKGVAIMFQRQSNVQIKQVIKSKIGRYLIINAELEGKQFLLVNIYAPNKDEPQFFANIVMQIESFPTDFKIIGGDMNVTLNEELDRFSKKEKSQRSKSAELINEFLETENWVDIWRVCHPETKVIHMAKEKSFNNV